MHPQWLESGAGPRLVAEGRPPAPVAPRGTVTLDDALSAVERHLLLLPPHERDAVASALQGWASSGGAAHWRRLVLAAFEAAPSGKRRVAGHT